MRRYLPRIGILLLFFCMLIFPQAVFSGARSGLLLWFETVLPTLLPFIMISGLLISTGAFTCLTRIIGPVIQALFGTSREGSFAVLTGFLCGYPMGAKVTADLYQRGHISMEEASYLLSFCNNTSIGFIINFTLLHGLKLTQSPFPCVILLLLSPFLCSLLFRFYYLRKYRLHSFPERTIHTRKAEIHLDFAQLDHCIMDSFSTITNVGGYIIIFSVLIALLGSFQVPAMLLAPLEITTGIQILSTLRGSFRMKFVSIMALTSFGGFCAAAQTSCMVKESGLKLLPYIAEKLITALVTSFLSLLYLYLIE
ncbi:MAG TPA: transporter [Lachnospiraceae bacterium]|nr:transporter [Lachnospiraceae bacterium]